MSTEAINLRRAIDEAKFSTRQLWQKIDLEPDAKARAEMKREFRESYVPELKALLEELERLSNA